MSEQNGTYDVNVIFRGLFLAKETEAGLAILFPDGRNPQDLLPRPGETICEEDVRKLHARVGPYQEHFGAMEFRLSDWRNRSLELPDLLHVSKPTKEPVAITMLGTPFLGFSSTDFIRFRPLRGRRPALPDLRSCKASYRECCSRDTMKILEHDDSSSFDLLAPYKAGVAVDAWRRCVGFCLFEVGEVSSERRSQNRAGEDLQWSFVPARDFDSSGNPPRDRELRSINLDLKVRFALELGDALVVELIPKPHTLPSNPAPLDFLPPLEGSGGTHTFLLRPEDPGRGIDIWIKNRELSRTLFDSDREGDSAVLCDREFGIDRDHGLLMRIAADPGSVTIPTLRPDGISNCGAACGGCGG